MKPIILLVGPSGSGKTTVATILEERYGMKPLWSYTTRPPRCENEPGHVFVTEEEFQRVGEQEGGFVGYTCFNGYHYGTTTAQALESDVYVIDPYGVKYMKSVWRQNKPIYVVGLTVPENVALQRMLTRGDSIQQARERVEHDRTAFANFTELCDLRLPADLLSADSIACMIVNQVKKHF